MTSHQSSSLDALGKAERSTDSEKPEIKVRGRKQAKSTEQRPDKIKHSCYLITYNPNISRFQDDDADLEEQQEILSDACESLLQNIEQYVKFGHEGHAWSTDVIENVSCDFVVERGKKKQQLHCHMLVKISHRSKVSLDYQKIKQTLNQEIGVESAYMNAKLVRATSDDYLLSYLNKGYNS
jgi:hypothetical protein